MTDTPEHDETPNGGGDLLPRNPATPAAPAPASAAAGPRLSRNRKFALLGGTVAVIGLGAIAAPVVAQTITSGDDDRGGKHEQFERALTAKLGVPQEKVDRALTAMQGDRLDQRVDELRQSGALTADQATAIKEKLAGGDVPGALMELRAAMSAQRLDELATAGTITQAQADRVSALIAAGVPVGIKGAQPGKAEGQRPPHAESAEHQQRQLQELQERGVVTAAQVQELAALINAGKTDAAETAIHAAKAAGRIAELVEAGTVTQAQADELAALIKAGMPIGLDGPGRGHGGHGMGGGQHGAGKGGGQHGADGGFDGPPPGGERPGQDSQYQPQSLGGGEA
jgi:polyhydroxyalkanoate synthesis regulator phasin